MQELQTVEIRAKELIAKHLPEGWTFGWHNKVRSNGTCYYGSMEIKLSRKLTPHRTWEDTYETIIHEISHAIAGAEAKHGERWKSVYRSLGGSGNRCSSDNASVHVPHKWELRFGDELVKRYFRKPNQSTFAKLPHMWLTGRKSETYGKLEIIKV